MMLNKFWQEVAQAYERVFVEHSLSIAVERDNKRAEVEYNDGAVLIDIVEVDTRVKEVLPVP
jgi:hypothetical protein